ncbi:MAG: hypothetical protein ACP5D7_10735 [Limnospira sp.]
MLNLCCPIFSPCGLKVRVLSLRSRLAIAASFNFHLNKKRRGGGRSVLSSKDDFHFRYFRYRRC